MIGNTPVDKVHEFRYLGTILDHSLNFESHIRSLKSKITSRLYTLRKIRWTLKTNDALTLYRSAILPYFDQGSLYYQCANKNILSGLQTLQNKALRIIYTRRQWVNTDTVHKTSRLLPIHERNKLILLKHAHHKALNNVNLRDIRKTGLRSSNKTFLKKEIPKCTSYERSFIHRSTILWNNLSEEMKQIPNMNSFKTHTKTELLLGNINFPE